MYFISYRIYQCLIVIEHQCVCPNPLIVPSCYSNPSAPAPMDAAPAEGAKDHLTDSDGELSSWSD